MQKLGTRLVIASAVISAIAFSAPASATTFLSFNGASGVFGNVGVPTTKTFTDVFSFSLPKAGTLGVAVTSITALLKLPKGTDLDFTSVTLTGAGFTASFLGNTNFRQGVQLVPAGPVELEVKGRARGDVSYAGTLAFVAAVPEPEAWAMMLVGAGLAGSALRLRRRRWATASA